MPKVVRSAKGKEVDFDMLKIKQQIASAPKPTSVKAREDFIDQKFKRRLKRLKRDVAKKAVDIQKTEEPKDTDTKTEE